jgi:hypothetical protein
VGTDGALGVSASSPRITSSDADDGDDRTRGNGRTGELTGELGDGGASRQSARSPSGVCRTRGAVVCAYEMFEFGLDVGCLDVVEVAEQG